MRNARLFLLVLCLALPFTASAQKPEKKTSERIVSTDLCADQYVLLLAKKDRIASVSIFAKDPDLSVMAERAKNIPANDGTTEAVTHFSPDLVLSGDLSNASSVDALVTLGYRVVAFDPPKTFDGIRERMKKFAVLFDELTVARETVWEMEDTLKNAGTREDAPRAVIFMTSGMVAGKGTIPDEVLEQAGIVNAAAEIDIAGFKHISLRDLRRMNPDMLVFETKSGHPSHARQLFSHPSLNIQFLKHREVREMPAALWRCATPETAKAVDRLTRPENDGTKSEKE